MLSTDAAIWSAVAASFAALSSFLIMLVQRRNLQESVRPELVLMGWSRNTEGQGDGAWDVIAFRSIKNVGKGAAFHVMVNAFRQVPNGPTAVLGTIRLPIIAVNEAIDVDGRILVSWKRGGTNVERHDHLPITVTILCWDSVGRQHEKRFSFLAVDQLSGVGVVGELAPGVGLANWNTIVRPAWFLKLSATVRRLPVVGSLVSRAKRSDW